jgi:hypothetical protein
MATPREMAEFFRDESLAELQERLKIGDGLLDVIDLVENQHSAIMGWLLAPREGHGQGDSILRDFLTHVSDQAVKRWAKKVSKHTDITQGFARNWPVQRLHTASLGAAFAVTEFSSEIGNRLDLLIVDPENRFLIAVENKLARFRTEQLKRYRKYVLLLQKDTPALQNLQLAFVALAKDFDPDDEDGFDADLRKELSHWVPASYDWLKAGARRAELHTQRGNAGARLVQDYCQRQTGWQSPNDIECAKLVAQVWRKHHSAAAAIAEMGRKPQRAWMLGNRVGKDVGRAAQLYAAQNQAVVEAIIDGRGFNSVRQQLLQRNEHFTENLVNYGRTWIDVMPRGVQPLYDADVSDYFPVFLNAYRTSETTSRVRLLFRPASVANKVTEESVRGVLTAFNPGFGKMKNFNRRIILKASVANDDLPAVMATYEDEITKRFQLAFSS